MLDPQLLSLLGLGFLLGARHALDADHVAAVATILSERPSLRASGLIGFYWGIGHTTVLLIVGIVIVLFKVAVPDQVAAGFEFLVGLMLVGLGGSLASSILKERWHYHRHEHGGRPHLHLHRHDSREHDHAHWLQGSLKPLLVGMVHGLAGSAALALLAASAARTVGEAILYMMVFGFGSVLGMVLLGMIISVPLVMSAANGRRTATAIQGLASLASIGLGLSMIMMR
jgi:high-affinity nickel permease